MTAQRIGSGLARGADRDIGFLWALALGIGLVVVALLGFTPNPLVGVPSSPWGSPLFLTGNMLDVIHLVLGAVLLYAALGLTVRRRANVLVAVGIVELALFLLGLVSGDLFGLVAYHTSLLDQLVLLAIAAVTIGVGFVARGGTLASLRTRASPAVQD